MDTVGDEKVNKSHSIISGPGYLRERFDRKLRPVRTTRILRESKSGGEKKKKRI